MKAILKKIFKPIYLSWYCSRWPVFQTKKSRRVLEKYIYNSGDDSKWLNIGSGGKVLGSNFVNLDIYAGPNIDIVASADNIPLEDDMFDGIASIAVLEYVRFPELVVKEIYRVLKSNAVVFIEVPFMQPVHAAPSDFQRYTLEGLKMLFHEFDVLECGVSVGPASSLAWILKETLSILLSGGSQKMYQYLQWIISPIVMPITWLDFFLESNPLAYISASGYYIVLRKSIP
jgi:SAM-dependent methyltransferase